MTSQPIRVLQAITGITSHMTLHLVIPVPQDMADTDSVPRVWSLGQAMIPESPVLSEPPTDSPASPSNQSDTLVYEDSEPVFSNSDVLSQRDPSQPSWFGTPISALNRTPACSSPLPSLKPDSQHTVLFREAILTYNSRYANRWDFRGLHSFFTEYLDDDEARGFFKVTLPAMVKLALRLPEIVTQSPPLLKKQMRHSITLSQLQVASLLSNAFFCTFPRRNAYQRNSEYSSFPSINFNDLFKGGKHGVDRRRAEKLKTLVHYFKRVTARMPCGTLTFRRQSFPKMPVWKTCKDPLTRLHVSAEGMIEEDGTGMLQVDFANKVIGGGVLGFGLVQEEIRFLICPEMILSRLFTETLEADECLVIIGLIQMMSSAVAKRDLAYFTFGDAQLAEDLYKMHEFAEANSLSVGDLWNVIQSYHRTCAKTSRKPAVELFSYIYQMYSDFQDSTDEEGAGQDWEEGAEGKGHGSQIKGWESDEEGADGTTERKESLDYKAMTP
uniref:poly(ADP-ribose) glycohydrolase n=1 Tax=Branchiostoma floridae TaxID=7739 RepID=C3Z5C9_BRAFL|eukprot:XP_002596030.1 hypothetical protein BRAFLDRAFT_118079 [Branchiostoma floridae]